MFNMYDAFEMYYTDLAHTYIEIYHVHIGNVLYRPSTYIHGNLPCMYTLEMYYTDLAHTCMEIYHVHIGNVLYRPSTYMHGNLPCTHWKCTIQT